MRKIEDYPKFILHNFPSHKMKTKDPFSPDINRESEQNGKKGQKHKNVTYIGHRLKSQIEGAVVNK